MCDLSPLSLLASCSDCYHLRCLLSPLCASVALSSCIDGSHLLDGTEVVAYAVPSASVASRGYVPPAAYVSPYAAPNGVVYTPTHGTVYLPAGQPDTHAYRVAPPSVASQHPTAYRTPNHRVTQPPVAPSALSTVHLLTNRPATASSRRRVAASQRKFFCSSQVSLLLSLSFLVCYFFWCTSIFAKYSFPRSLC